MAFTSGFFNSLRGDRKYNAEQMSEIFDGVLKDGIIASQGQLFDVNTANNGMQITVGTGRAWFDHTWSKNDSVMVLTVEPSDVTRPRYDTVVLEVNHGEDVRANSIKIVKGVAAVNADKPILLNTDTVKQYPLAHIYVEAGVEEIKASQIENMVGREPTVFATGILETAPLDDLWSQWKGEWEEWFAGIKLQLSGDIVTNLQYQIDQLRERHIKDYNYLMNLLKMIQEKKALVTIHVQDEFGAPLDQIYITNVKINNTENAYTDSNGDVQVLMDETSSFKPSFPNYIDLESFTSTATKIDAGNEYTIVVTAKKRNFIKIISTGNYYISKSTTKIDASLVGGGGSGGVGVSEGSTAAGGGGGGVMNIEIKNTDPTQLHVLTIGSGGSAVSASNEGAGKNGGETLFDSYSISGGTGGYAVDYNNGTSPTPGGPGGGRGGPGSKNAYTSLTGTQGNGTSGSVKYYTSFTEAAYSTGGGGACGTKGSNSTGQIYTTAVGNGATYGGGGGGYLWRTYTPEGYAGTSGSDGGGGGAGGGYYSYNNKTINSGSGSGGRGFIAIRCYS